MKYFLVLGLVSVLAACSSDDSSNKGKKFGGGSGSPAVNQTDYRACNGTTPAGLNIYSNRWYMRQSQTDNGVEFKTEINLEVRSGEMLLSQTCMVQNTWVTASVIAKTNITDNALVILEAANRVEKVDQNGVSMECSIAVDRATMNYVFKGRCLELSYNGDTVLMAPR